MSMIFQVVMDNGLVNVTLSSPQGMVTAIQYNGIDNLLEPNRETNRGYHIDFLLFSLNLYANDE